MAARFLIMPARSIWPFLMPFRFSIMPARSIRPARTTLTQSMHCESNPLILRCREYRYGKAIEVAEEKVERVQE
jgi:hypothetical protein